MSTVDSTRIRATVADGDLIRITRIGREFVAVVADTGTDVTDLIRRYVRKKAFEADSGLRCVYTKTGSVQWRKVDNASVDKVWDAFQLTVTPAEPIEMPSVDGTMSHSEVLSFLDKAYSVKPDLLVMSEIRWKYVMRSTLRGRNLMFVGPAGSGKTLACQSVAETFPDREFFYFNLGASQDPRGMLIGNTHFAEGEGTFVSEALFVKAIQTPGAIILMDELSRAHDDAANILMTVFDKGQRYLRIDEKPDTPTIKVADGVVFLATANIGNEYTGTRVMDRALLDRFAIIEMEPLNQEEESGLLRRLYPDVDIKMIEAVAGIAGTTREEFHAEEPKVSTIVSTRASVEITSLIHDGFSLAEAAEVCIYPFFDASGGVDSERVFMKQLVQRYIPNEATDDKDTPWAEGQDADADATATSTANKNPW